MVTELLKSYAEILAGRFLVNLLLVGSVLGVVAILAFGTDSLTALGIPRAVAGSFTVLLVVALCTYGMYWFATRMIDW